MKKSKIKPMQTKKEKIKKGAKTTLKAWVKPFVFVIGTISLMFGAFGVLMPVIPGTPLIIFGVICYVNSCKPIARLMLKNKQLNEIVANHNTKSGISITTKVIIVATMCVSLTVSLLFVKNIFAQSAILLLYAIMALKILLTKTKKEDKS